MQVNNLVQVQSFFVELFRPIFEEVIAESMEKYAKTQIAQQDPEALLDIHGAAELLGVIPSDIRKLEKSGELKGYEVANYIRYKKSEILKQLKQK
jgi:hypothetical protein